MHHRLDTDKQVFCYMDEFYCLSNFAAFRLEWWGLDFDTAEHAYHWEKFRSNYQATIGEEIRHARSAHDAYRIAAENRAFIKRDWDTIKPVIMKQILTAKVEQHPYVLKKLMETGDREIVEDSWRDAYWGWGPDRRGLNMLGKLWMEVRDDMRILVKSNRSDGRRSGDG